MFRPHPAVTLPLIVVALSWTFPVHLVAQEQVTAASVTAADQIKPVSLVLGSDGVLHGSAFDGNGKPAKGRTVVLGKEGKPIAKAIVSEEGLFRFPNIKPGDYQIATSDAAAYLQCHSAEVAPVNAVKRIILSQKAMIARGQQPARVLLQPLLIGLVIAAAIVIPIAVSNSDDAS